MKDIEELKKIAHDLVEKREAPAQKRDQALSSSVVSLRMLDDYGKVPQLEDMDPHDFGLAPVDSEGRRIFVYVRKAPFYLRDDQLGKYDVFVFASYDNNKIEFFGWLPDSEIHTMPVKLFTNSSPYMVTADLMYSMPESFDFNNGCDTLTCSKPAIWSPSLEGWDCVSCDKVRFSTESRAKHGISDS